MKKITKTIWVRALHSNKYKQGYGRMNEGINYCALAVLCKITGNDASIFQLTLLERNHIMKMNDIKHFSFKKIADWISANL